jgi:hypothetical protein
MSRAAVGAALWLASGYAKDVSGSNDHPALSRIAGSTIAMYERKDQAEIRIPLERVISICRPRNSTPSKQPPLQVD